jgi:hypothetical protein
MSLQNCAPIFVSARPFPKAVETTAQDSHQDDGQEAGDQKLPSFSA